MFRIPRVNVIESNTGFAVEVLGRDEIRYTEGDRSIKINSELLVGPSVFVIYTSSIIHWDPPYDAETIDPTAQSRIIKNIRDAFRFRSIDIKVK